ncbi:MAG: FIST N-terminal domain-containing protein [Rubrivivax sp.]
MNDFIVGHAAHPDWRMALSLVAAQLDGQGATAPAPNLGLVYLCDHHAAQAEALWAALHQRWPAVSWAGSVGVGVAASGVEYFDEPGLVVMLGRLPDRSFRVFSGEKPLKQDDAFTALVHADPQTPDLAELLLELSHRTRSGYLFGGLCASRGAAVQIADGVRRGGLSGVGFTQQVALVSRVTQGCQPVGPVRTITAADGNLILALDGAPALPCLLRDLGASEDDPRVLLPRLRATLVGLSDASEDMLSRAGQFGTDTRVRHLIGLDPARGGVAVAETVRPGMRAAFCQRDVVAARRDLVRICSEIREELESLTQGAAATVPAPPQPAAAAKRIAAAVYISCSGRGGPHFGGPSAELQIIRHALGDVPLVGFFAGGEIARHHLYGYTGVLTVFTAPA